MVKSPHAIELISTGISRAGAGGVRLKHASCERRGTAALGTAPITSEPLVDAAAAIQAALAAPLEYPPLAAAVVPGDRVAITVDDEVPCLEELVRGAIEAFLQSGIERQDIAIVASDERSVAGCREAVAENGSPAPRVFVHDPNDNDNLCLVGTTKRREPLLVNRTIFDADVVLPIGATRPDRGVYDSLFPRFSDAATIGRHRTPTNLASSKTAHDQASEKHEAGWLIGAPLVVQVVPGCGETAAHVLAGEAAAVERSGHALYRARWSLECPERVDLVIATLPGGSRTQRWENVARALETADQLLTEDGAVAICSNLESPPGESLARLMGAEDLAKAERKILHDHAADSWPAWQLVRALRRGPVYLLSQLEEDVVEEMGLAPVADISEIVRLAGRHESFALIEDSQHAVVSLRGV